MVCVCIWTKEDNAAPNTTFMFGLREIKMKLWYTKCGPNFQPFDTNCGKHKCLLIIKILAKQLNGEST